MELPTEPDAVAPHKSQELPAEQAKARCRSAPSPVKTVESPSDVGLNVSLAKESIEETSSLPTQKTKAGRVC